VAKKPQIISKVDLLMIEKHNDVYDRIGSNLKALRKKAGLTQQQLADKCEKVDRAKISDIENAKEDYMFSTLLEIAKGLGVTIEKLIK